MRGASELAIPPTGIKTVAEELPQDAKLAYDTLGELPSTRKARTVPLPIGIIPW